MYLMCIFRRFKRKMKRIIRNITEEKPDLDHIFSSLALPFGIGFLIFWLVISIPGVFDILKNNFDNYTYVHIKLILKIISISILVYLLWFLWFITKRDGGVRKFIKEHFSFEGVWWILLTFLIMFNVLAMGIFFINALVGVRDIDLLLYDPNGSIGKRLNCELPKGLEDYGLLSGVKVNCSLPGKFEFNSSKIQFRLLDGTEKNITLETFNFQAPEKTIHINMDLIAKKENGGLLNFSASEKVRFRTLEEDQERQDKFLTYLMGLLGFVFFAVPSMVLNIRKIFQKKI